MPEEVRAEIAPWFIGKQAIADDVPEKIVKLDNKAKYVNRDLKVTYQAHPYVQLKEFKHMLNMLFFLLICVAQEK